MSKAPAKRKIGQVVKRGENRFLIRIPNGTDANRKRLYYNETFHGTEDAAELRRMELVVSLRKGTLATNANETLNEYMEHFFNSTARTVRHNTQSGYKLAYNAYVKPALGKKALKDITTVDMQGVIDELNQRKLAPSTVRHCAIVMNKAFTQAIAWGKLYTNPVNGVVKPRQTSEQVGTVLTRNELNQYLDATLGWAHAELLWTLALTGIRYGEALGLTWADVDLDRMMLHVERSISYVDGVWTVNPPKNKRSKRSISFFPNLAERLEAIHTGNPNAYVFPGRGRDGKPLHPHPVANSVRARHTAALKRAGLPLIRLHDLRHTHATLLLESGVPVSLVSARLGHARESITTDVYSHVTRRMRHELDTQAKRVFGGLGTHSHTNSHTKTTRDNTTSTMNTQKARSQQA